MDINTSQISKKLIAYLRSQLNDPAIQYASPLTRLQGGYETFTFRFQLEGAQDQYAGHRILRLYPEFYGPYNAIWESTVQNVLAGEGFPVAKAHLICTEMSLLGGAFFIMEYIPGELLMFAPPETVPGLLGRTHAELHAIDPDPLRKALHDQDIDPYRYSLHAKFDWLKERASKYAWMREGVNWLAENRPPEPASLSVCHGDFHALNILVSEGIVTGVLDWPGFAVADPVYDIANTVMLTSIPGKHLSASMEGLSSIDWDRAAELYLSAYLSRSPLDLTHLPYYKITRCLMALVQGAEGQQVWQHPGIQADILACIREIASIRISLPA